MQINLYKGDFSMSIGIPWAIQSALITEHTTQKLLDTSRIFDFKQKTYWEDKFTLLTLVFFEIVISLGCK